MDARVLRIVIGIAVLSVLVIYLSKRVPGWLRRGISWPVSYIVTTMVALTVMSINGVPDAHILSIGMIVVVTIYGVLELWSQSIRAKLRGEE